MIIQNKRIESKSLTWILRCLTKYDEIELYKIHEFVEEGLLIKDCIHKEGNYYNTVIVRILLDKCRLTN